ncbi:uncharacterized protein BO95DRAFT_452931 [Aspergillus brunneoviolaceus CBS 621.78]|uniref:Uncharacterized protein n=1 Tax=Aspergillus brunneoviolaceus CBS 621.78 TaxID=1450534 RepID=A0ACD1G9W7_9EURO|nr:hypothetical protein BO95DRAFT_452931 [Aspergillus brunneoviolaceus CBS 621.78]RAH46062.1 hypothetical protein BO95DRAFT_452931 [Aspergillus brunneoviolaceus CBS 621.78]
MLARLLRDHLIENGWKVFFMGTWGVHLIKFAPDDYDNAWDDRYPKQNPAVFSAPNSLLLVDEAQASYKDEILWGEIIKEQLNGIVKRDMRICLVCSYGSPTTGVEPGIFIPAEFTTSQRITITPQQIPGSPQIGLFYTRLEFDDAVSRKFQHQYHDNFTLHEEAGGYIFSFTNGHPGAVNAIVSYIYEHVILSLKEDEEIWTHLASCSVARSFPKGPKLTPRVVNVLGDIAEQGSIEWEENNEGMGQCYVNGWIHKTVVLDATCPIGKDMVVLPSRLHEKWVERFVGGIPASLPLRFDALQTLCCEVLGRFSVMSLRHASKGKKMSSASTYRAVEAQYQDEFYKAFRSVAGRAVPICSERSRTQDGRADFYIPEKKWAIEVLRDHRKIDEHVLRFREGGAYYGWIEDGTIQEWIVIDSATILRNKVYREPNLIHAIFLADYTELQVFGRQRLSIYKARLQN